MLNLGIIVNRANPRAPEALRQVVQAAGRLGLALHADEPTCRLAGGGSLRPVPSVRAFKDLVGAVVVLGGDGTLLRAARTFILVALGADSLRRRLGWFARHEAAVSVVTGSMLVVVGFLIPPFYLYFTNL